MIIFGDDGFRDLTNKGLLRKEFLKIFFLSFDHLIKKISPRKIIIGYDTRNTYTYILKIILENIITPIFIEIVNHPISTPGLQYLSKLNNCMGIMITASHFSFKYNGFKFFLGGKKISKSNEKYIVKRIRSKKTLVFKKKPVIKKINSKLYNKFINKIKINKSSDKILFDCANGSLSGFFKKINFFKKYKIINTKKFSNKINLNCGTNHIVKNSKKNIFKKYNYYIAFDGDADRFLVFKKNYGVIETEKIALIFIKYFQNKMKIHSIVGTEVTNPWLNNNLRAMNVKFIKSKVGDRNVIKKKIKNKSFIGFETSGHFCFDTYMDGLQSALFFLKILNENPKIIEEVLSKRINFKRKIYEISNYKILKKIFKLTKKKKLKMVVRKSIWSKKIKIYFFINQNSFVEKENFKKLVKYKFFKKEIKN